MFAGLRSVVSEECCAEVLGYGSKEVALRRLLGEALVRFALKRYWQSDLRKIIGLPGEKGKPWLLSWVWQMFFLIFRIRETTLFVPCLIREIGD